MPYSLPVQPDASMLLTLRLYCTHFDLALAFVAPTLLFQGKTQQGRHIFQAWLDLCGMPW
jgi:hypothetical protein